MAETFAELRALLADLLGPAPGSPDSALRRVQAARLAAVAGLFDAELLPDPRAALAAACGEPAPPPGRLDRLEREVCGHLAAFFRRCYRDGDLIGALGPRGPDEGRDVALGWSGSDQFYVNTHEQGGGRRGGAGHRIHKDLRGHLRRELDGHLREAALPLDAIEADPGPAGLPGLIRAARRLGRGIIDRLAEVEERQRRLWLRPRFVLAAHYCATLDLVPEDLYPAVAACEGQREEWARLFGVEGPRTVEAIRASPSLAADTRHFPPAFKARLLAACADLDERLDGLLVHGENFQALQLLRARYGGQVRCGYIDPPYNRGDDGFPYRDSYRRSAWLSMMADRCRLGAALLAPDGHQSISIGDEEVADLRLALEPIFAGGLVNCIAVRRQDKNLSLQFLGQGLPSLAVGFEYVLVYRARPGAVIRPVFAATSAERAARGYWKGFWNDADRPTMRYELLGVTPEAGQWKWRAEVAAAAAENYRVYQREFAAAMSLEQYWERTGRRLRFIRRNAEGRGRNRGVEHWVPPAATKLRTSDWTDLLAMRSIRDDLGLDFPSPKNTALIEQLIALTCDAGGTVLDYFAGSGTTAHGVINLNRRDGGRRRYILVELGAHFDTVLRPRVLKAIYAQDWRGGRPVRPAGGGHMLKELRLEPFADALARLAPPGRDLQEDDPARAALDADAFARPFDFRLPDQQGVAGAGPAVDLVETFAYLLGLRVQRVGGAAGLVAVAGRTPEGLRALVIWRERGAAGGPAGLIDGPGEFDLIYANDDGDLERLRSAGAGGELRAIGPEFRRLMFGEA